MAAVTAAVKVVRGCLKGREGLHGGWEGFFEERMGDGDGNGGGGENMVAMVVGSWTWLVFLCGVVHWSIDESVKVFFLSRRR